MATTRLPERDDEVAEGAVAYALDKKIDLGSLSVQLAAAANVDRVAAVSTSDVLWVLDDRVDDGLVEQVVAAHEPPDPSAAIDEDVQRRAALDDAESALRALAAKEDDKDYDDGETQRILRALLAPYKE